VCLALAACCFSKTALTTLWGKRGIEILGWQMMAAEINEWELQCFFLASGSDDFHETMKVLSLNLRRANSRTLQRANSLQRQSSDVPQVVAWICG